MSRKIFAKTCFRKPQNFTSSNNYWVFGIEIVFKVSSTQMVWKITQNP